MNAVRFFPAHFQSALYAEVIFLRFEAVVLAAGYTELEFVRKLPRKESFVKLLCERVCVDTAARAYRRALTGGNGTHTRTADSGLNSAFTESILYFIDLIKFNERYLDALTRGEVNVSVAVFFRDLGYFRELLGSDISSDYAKTKRKVVLLLLPHESAFFEC